MATVKICTQERTHWIADVRELILAERFNVEHFDDPLEDCDCPAAITRGDTVHVTLVVDFHPPDKERDIPGDSIGHVLWIRRDGEDDLTRRVVAPARSCFLMSDQGATVDRI